MLRARALYGRRRVGKTALLSEWIQHFSPRALYWVASPTSAATLLRSFSQAIYNFSNPGASAPATFTFATWEQAFSQVASLADWMNFGHRHEHVSQQVLQNIAYDSPRKTHLL